MSQTITSVTITAVVIKSIYKACLVVRENKYFKINLRNPEVTYTFG
jgi:hypothetical protein